MNATLETALRQIATENDLTVVSVSFSANTVEGYTFGANVHWDGFSRDNISCSHGFGADIAAALKDALAKAKADRVPFVEQLPTITLAA